MSTPDRKFVLEEKVGYVPKVLRRVAGLSGNFATEPIARYCIYSLSRKVQLALHQTQLLLARNDEPWNAENPSKTGLEADLSDLRD